MPVYQHNPEMRRDSEFEPGALPHLVVGNTGRLLDPRRTPVTIVKLRPQVGTFIVRLDDFEDRGANWEVEFEKVDRYQFERGSAKATAEDTASFRSAIERFDRVCSIPCDAAARDTTKRKLESAETAAHKWLTAHSEFLRAGASLPDPSTRRGDARLAADLTAYMKSLELASIEHAVAKQYVRNPYSGEIIKGHRMAIAELGLVPYEGKIFRDPATFEGDWTRERRARHIIARLSFMRALFKHLSMTTVMLYRGFATDDRLRPPDNETFTSASFDRNVANAHFNAINDHRIRALYAQRVPTERLFMTYHETAAMNERYLEAEAVLLWEHGNTAF